MDLNVSEFFSFFQSPHIPPWPIIHFLLLSLGTPVAIRKATGVWHYTSDVAVAPTPITGWRRIFFHGGLGKELLRKIPKKLSFFFTMNNIFSVLTA